MPSSIFSSPIFSSPELEDPRGPRLCQTGQSSVDLSAVAENARTRLIKSAEPEFIISVRNSFINVTLKDAACNSQRSPWASVHSGESNRPPTPILLKRIDASPISIAILLEKHALLLAESIYTTNLYHDTAPICITIILQKY